MATSRIKETKYPKTNSKGSSCLVVLEDKTDGFFNYDGEFPFALGEEVEYTATKTEKKSKPGEFYNVFTLKKVGTPSSTTPPTESKPALEPSIMEWHGVKNIIDMKFEARLHLIELITRLLVAGKIEYTEVKPYFTEWVIMVDTAIDELKG